MNFKQIVEIIKILNCFHVCFVSFLFKMTHCAEAVGKGLKKEKRTC